MRNRTTVPTPDVNGVIDLNCEPDLSPERQAEARQLLQAAFGASCEPVLRACGQAAAARRELAAAVVQLERLLHGPQLRGIVTAVHNGRVRLVIGGIERVLPRPQEMELGVGQTVLTDADGRSLVAAGDFLVGGQAFVFCEHLEERYALVRALRDGPSDELRQLALISDSVARETLAAGDRVLGWTIDGGNVVVVTRRLGRLATGVADQPGVARSVRRDEIVGLDEILEEAELLFLEPAAPAFRALLGRANRALAGLVFQGAPGCGKTMLAEYLIAAVRARGGRALYRTASHYLSMWVGQGAASLRADFARLDEAYAESGVRPLLVIDELEAIALDRSHPAALSAGFLDVLTTLLSLLTRSETRMIGISNVANRVLEVALTRDGRLRMVEFPPTLAAKQVERLVASSLAGVPLADPAGGSGRSEQELAGLFGGALADLIFAPSGALAEFVRVQLADGRELVFGARELATAATIADGVIRPSLARGVRRDLRAGRATPAPLTLEELRAATIDHFLERASQITRENVRGVLGHCIPEEQAVVKVERPTSTRFRPADGAGAERPACQSHDNREEEA